MCDLNDVTFGSSAFRLLRIRGFPSPPHGGFGFESVLNFQLSYISALAPFFFTEHSCSCSHPKSWRTYSSVALRSRVLVEMELYCC